MVRKVYTYFNLSYRRGEGYDIWEIQGRATTF